MLTLVVLASALMGDAPANQAPADPAAVWQAYAAVQTTFGRSTDGQLRLAYWCEDHGLTAERGRHLALALLADPGNAAARGLLGLVSRDGRWVRPEAVAREQATSPSNAALLAEYDAKRSSTPYTAGGQFALGVWADDHDLKDQARAHFTAAVRIDPAKELAWKRLGFVKHDGRWQTVAQVRATRADAEAQHAADLRWKPLLIRWKEMLARPGQQAEAENHLAGVTDPRALPMVARVFGRGETDQPRAVQLLGQIDSPNASKALAYLAVFGKSEPARRAATETLRGRDARDYADYLIGFLQDRIKYEITPVAGPGSSGVLHIEGKQANLDRIYAPPVPQLQPGDQVELDRRHGLVVRRDVGLVTAPWIYLSDYHWGESPAADAAVLASLQEKDATPITRFQFTLTGQATFSVARIEEEARNGAKHAQQQLTGDARVLERRNGEIDRFNDRFAAILRAGTGQAAALDREGWTRWWVDLVGYRYASTDSGNKATIIEQVPIPYQPQFQPIDIQYQVVGYERRSCFGAGTQVQTLSGPRAIETLAVGDIVLTQDPATGGLGYQPVVATHHNPPSGTFRIKLGGEAIVASPFHRFWVAGRGWVMARDLQAGDRLRTLGGIAAVESVNSGQIEPVFNLDVAQDATFFAGRTAALVHDNTLPDPRLVPFDTAAPGKAVAAR